MGTENGVCVRRADLGRCPCNAGMRTSFCLSEKEIIHSEGFRCIRVFIPAVKMEIPFGVPCNTHTSCGRFQKR
jgi:hypothetical protein